MSATDAAFLGGSPGAASSGPGVAASSDYRSRARALLRQRVPHGVLIACLSGTLDVLRALPLFLAMKEAVWEAIATVYLTSGITSALLVVGVSIAEAVALHRGFKVLVMLVAAWVAVLFGCVLVLPISLSPYSLVHAGLVSSLASHLMYFAWEYTAIGTALVLFYAAQERELELAEAARETELERAKLQRSMMASRLSVLRARVEPEFLFGTLREVQALYRQDRNAADDMIDALITYLRAALPQIRGDISSVGSEVDLMLAYVAVLQVPRGDTLHVEARVDPAARDQGLPATVLLSIAQAAFSSDDRRLRRRFAVLADRDTDGARVILEVEGGQRPEEWRDEGSVAAHRVLWAYYGAAARLIFSSDGTIHRARLRLQPGLPQETR